MDIYALVRSDGIAIAPVGKLLRLRCAQVDKAGFSTLQVLGVFWLESSNIQTVAAEYTYSQYSHDMKTSKDL